MTSRAGGVEPIDAVLVFDLDDTLYLERDYVESGLRAVGGWMRCQLGTSDLGSLMVEWFRKGHRGHLFDEALADAGMVPSAALVARMVQVYRQHRPRIRLAEDAERCLAGCPPRIALAIITDGYRDAQKQKIRALGLHDRGVRLAVCTDRWGRAGWKPAPRAFDHVQAFFRLPPGAFAYVADNPDKDFQAPKRLGWRTIEIIRPGRLHRKDASGAQQADRRIDSLDALSI